MEIYKINHICVNQLCTQFSLSYNKGIRIYRLKDFSQISCSNTDKYELGEVLISGMFYELSLVVFSGSENNQTYHNKKMVFWDNDKKYAICSTQFKSEIINLKVMKKLTFVNTKDEINICSFNEKYNLIEIISKVCLDSNTNNSIFEAWISNNDKKYYLAHVMNKAEIQINVIYENCLELEKFKKINTGFQDVQNIIYNERLKILFVIDENGMYIKGFTLPDFIDQFNFYRGSTYSKISSITDISDKYIAVASSNKTIHIFELSQSSVYNNNNSISYFFKILTNPFKLHKSILKIRLNEIEKTQNFFDSFYQKKGVIILYHESSMKCIGYNGTTIIFNIDLSNQNYSYSVKEKFEWCLNKDIETSVYSSGSDDYSLDLIGWSNNKDNNLYTNKWKII